MLAKETLDCVHILVPPDHHHPLAKTALQSGVSVFLEKPMCTSVDEASELLALARENRVRLGVNHNFLFSDAFGRLRQAVHSGALGPIDYVSLRWFSELGRSAPARSTLGCSVLLETLCSKSRRT